MKLYELPKGTKGVLLKKAGRGEYLAKEWSLRKDLSFTDCIIDPIIYHNTKGKVNVPDIMNDYAQRGYALFGGEFGSECDVKYVFAIPYSQVKVLC